MRADWHHWIHQFLQFFWLALIDADYIGITKLYYSLKKYRNFSFIELDEMTPIEFETTLYVMKDVDEKEQLFKKSN